MIQTLKNNIKKIFVWSQILSILWLLCFNVFPSNHHCDCEYETKCPTELNISILSQYEKENLKPEKFSQCDACHIFTLFNTNSHFYENESLNSFSRIKTFAIQTLNIKISQVNTYKQLRAPPAIV